MGAGLLTSPSSSSRSRMSESYVAGLARCNLVGFQLRLSFFLGVELEEMETRVSGDRLLAGLGSTRA